MERERKRLTINTVIVSPDEGEELPLRALCYMADAIHLGTELERQGLNIKGLRIVNPCYLRVHCNGGDLEGQLAYGQAFCQSLASWKDQVWPGNALQISLDPGQPLSPGLEEEKASNSLDVISEGTREALFARADRYSTSETTDLYTRAHGPAWCYSHDSNFFLPLTGDGRVINLMPKSELLFLVALQEARVLDAAPETERPVSLVSSVFTHAPYLLLSENEPSLEFITDPNRLHPLKAKLRPLSGNPPVAETIRCLNRLQYILEQQNRV